MQMITRSLEDGAWQVDVVWSDLATATSLEQCSITRQRYQAKGFDRKEGTLIRILDLKATWDDLQVDDLNEALSRLTSPFEEIDDFAIYFAPPGSSVEASKIETSVFLKSPTYLLKGAFTSDGTLSYGYVYQPLSGKGRKESRSVDWAIVQKDINDSLKENRVALKDKPVCGPFEFEIRVWDLDQKSLSEAESKYDMRKADLRRQIRAFKGISLYRDRVLVLPKSDNNRDWLGLDLRRVSKVGSRLSTSQIVGYVAVTADANPDIDDTSDRERLARNEAVAEFERVLKDAVSRLEEQRDRDQELEEPKMRELFADISPQRLLDQAQELVAQNATLDEAMPLLNSYSKSAEKARVQIEKQFFYYSRLATIGTIAEMLVHEVGNNGGAIDAFVGAVKDWLEGKSTDRKLLDRRLAIASQAVATPQRLAERFRPLAARNFKRGRRTSSLSETIEASFRHWKKPSSKARLMWSVS
ncbi:MAG: hypothetical protein IPN38_16755 [Flavobacteriales bacterium]|nr:hypothetical protein [Flavobacteriales bacterium]